MEGHVDEALATNAIDLLGQAGRRVLVSGAGHGLGLAVASAFAGAGARVAALDIDVVTVEGVAEELGLVAVMQADVNASASIEPAVVAAIETLGGLDVVINCAAQYPVASLIDEPAELMEAVFQTNVAGYLRVVRAAVPALRRSPSGRIVNFASVMLFTADPPMMGAYVTSKAAIVGLTRALARELGPDGICVNSLAPGSIPTIDGLGRRRGGVPAAPDGAPVHQAHRTCGGHRGDGAVPGVRGGGIHHRPDAAGRRWLGVRLMAAPMRVDLRDRVAVVTGAGQGLGEAIAVALADAGARVAVTDVVQDRANTVAARLPGAAGWRLDVADWDGVSVVAARISASLGAPTILVNNAGVQRIAPSTDLSKADWQMVLDVNLAGTFRCAQAFAPGMMAAGGGCIVNVASINALVGMPGRAPYNASKAGVVAITQVLAAEWAALGIRVNAVAPGYVWTRMLEDAAATGYLWWRGHPGQDTRAASCSTRRDRQRSALPRFGWRIVRAWAHPDRGRRIHRLRRAGTHLVPHGRAHDRLTKPTGGSHSLSPCEADERERSAVCLRGSCGRAGAHPRPWPRCSGAIGHKHDASKRCQAGSIAICPMVLTRTVSRCLIC